jgi:hypothetical protein
MAPAKTPAHAVVSAQTIKMEGIAIEAELNYVTRQTA